MADADLDLLGREDFLKRDHLLRLELEALGMSKTDPEWITDQLNFLQSHTYFAPAARSLRTEKKHQNLEALKKLLRNCQDENRPSTLSAAGPGWY